MEIRKGQQALFVPCISKIRRTSKGAAAESLTALFESLKEVVEVMILITAAGMPKLGIGIMLCFTATLMIYFLSIREVVTGL
jgi:hypothetical protein